MANDNEPTVCRYCARPIQLDRQVWVHTDTGMTRCYEDDDWRRVALPAD